MMATTTRNSVSVDTEKWLQVLRIMVLTVSMVRLKAIQTNMEYNFYTPFRVGSGLQVQFQMDTRC